MSATIHHRTCHLCEAMCGIVIETDGDEILGIRGDADDPFSRGHICPKAPALAELHTDPDRLRTPLRRVGERFEPCSWDEALDLAARGLHDLQRQHGRDAVASYLGNPTVHHHGSALFAFQLVQALGSRNRYSATSLDQLPHQLASWLVFGHQLLMPVPDLERAGYILALGANPLASNGSIMTAPDVKSRLRELRARGGRLVLLDPRRTETAEVADEHIFIRPGTDALFLLALVHEVMGAGPRLRHLEPLVRGLDALRAAVEGFTPEAVAPATGIAPEVTRRIARELREREPAVVYGRMGVSTQTFGALCQWLIVALNILTGNFDRPGGAMFTTPATDALGAIVRRSGVSRGSLGRYASRVRKLPESGGELPTATLAEDILEPGEGRIRGLVVMAGNPVLSSPNGRQVDRALASLDFMVSIDCYVNETSRHAHVILPPISPLARSHYDVALTLLSVRNVAKWSPPVFSPPADGRDDWQILAGLAERVLRARGGHRMQRASLAMARRLGPDGILDLLLRTGPHGLLRGGLSLKRLERHPHGLDLGPLAPSLPKRLPKDHRFIELAPEPLLADLPRARAALATTASADEVLLIGRRHVRSCNSWMHNAPRLSSGKPRCTLLVHPDDARARGLADGAPAVVTSRVGAITVAVEVTDAMMPGVVSLPHGFGHDRPGVRLAVAGRASHAGASINDVTDERLVDAVSGVAVLSGVPVTVRPG